MTAFTVRGKEEEGPAAQAPSLGAFGDVVRVEEVRTVRVADVRSVEAQDVTESGSDVVQLELDGGITLWTSPERLQDTLQVVGARGVGDQLAIPPVLSFGPRTRGVGGLVLRALKAFKVDVAGATATVLAEELERKLEPGPGLYRWTDPRLHDPVPSGGGELPGGVPLLVFLHGTASNTTGSFGGLRNEERDPRRTDVWSPLVDRYRGNILALEHRTLSVSPIQNALDLVDALPEKAVLHLVSHSRGGLIGELLYRAQGAGGARLSDDVRQRFKKREKLEEFERLQALVLKVQDRRIRVERFVRVACPARGTTLASRRLDLWLSMMVNVVGLIPGLRGNPIYEFLTALTLGVAKTRADPERMPGLESMIPRSPLIGFLNESPVQADADLSVIAGDTQGGGIAGRLKILATDLFYRENHDLVVNTASMVGGIPRPEKSARLAFTKGSEVSHFAYFRNDTSARKLLTALTQPDTPGEFEPIRKETAEELKTRAPEEAAGTERPVVILIPGLMGSELWLPPAGGTGEGRRIWIDMEALGNGDFGLLDPAGPDSARVEARALVAHGYGALASYLDGAHEVVPFPYDWRLSLADAARRLGTLVAERLGRTQQPVRLLAHSSGGLVARLMIAQQPELWRKVMAREGGRLVMLGTPNGGSYRVVRLLLGQDPLVQGLELVDRVNTIQALTEMLGRMPGVLELLPPAEQPDLYAPAAWTAFGVTGPSAAALAAARAVQQTLAKSAPLDGRSAVYVAGTGHLTPVRPHLHTRPDQGKVVGFEGTLQGDGWTPWATGRLANVTTWFAPDAEHGELARWRAFFPAIAELLHGGTAPRGLMEQAPAGVRGGDETFLLREGEASFFPSETELVGAALGFEPRQRPDEVADEPLKVRVVHGNLRYVRHPLAVGHYAGDTINGAEKVVDETLDHSLSERRKLRLYPGPIETAAVFLREERTLRGALVVGLGEVGALTAARLERSFRHAVLEYASTIAERHPDRADGDVYAASLAALLIGSGRGGINLEDSVRALLRGAVAARAALAGSELGKRVRIDTLEFWELNEDLAIQAIRVVRRFAGEDRNPVRLAEETLVIRDGGRRRASFGAEEGWWDRMTVTLRGGEMVYETPTGRARVERRSVRRQKRLVDEFVSTLIKDITGAAGGPKVARTLFELLVPNDLKDYAPDRNDMILVLDKDTARFPWELLHDGSRDRPQAVERGLIRQFATPRFRQNPTMPINRGVLVVGNPPDTGFTELKGAEREARAAVRLLEAADFQVTPLIGADATFANVLNALFAGPYRILHIAAHGVHNYVTKAEEERAKRRCLTPRGVSGVVVGKGVFITSAEVEQMRAVPEVVFINCCNTGAIDADDPSRNRPGALAASLAEQLIGMGVRAVVAAGWPVEDNAAVTFAETFYTRMLDGAAFGDAVHSARRATYDGHPGTNTWGAYQCYGDHGYVLERSGDGYSPTPPPRYYHCTSEVLVELENLAADANIASQFSLPWLRGRLAELEQKIGPSWRRDAQVVSALANAHARVGNLARAVCYYRRLAGKEKARYPVAALEQLANLESRWAVLRYKTQLERGRRVDVQVYRRRILRTLARLRRMHLRTDRSSERWSLIGSAHKRLSQLEPTRAARLARVRRSEEAYREAHRVAVKRGGRVDPYPTRNWLSAHVVAQYLDTGIDDPAFRTWVDTEFADVMAKADEATSLDELDQPSFWSGATMADGVLVRRLADGTLPQHVDEIVAGYRVAWSRGGSEIALRSVVENLDWLIDVLSAPPAAAAPAPAAEATPSPPAGGGKSRRRAAKVDAPVGEPAAEAGERAQAGPSTRGTSSAPAGQAPAAPEGAAASPEIVQAVTRIRTRVWAFKDEVPAPQAGRR